MTNIKVSIAGRPYPLKVKPGDEQTIRSIVDKVNEKVNHFQKTYTKKDKQDCLSMALLTYAVDLHKAQSSDKSQSSMTDHSVEQIALSDKIHQLDELLENLLK
ncbi:MAG: cell division protein ZapA [Bacteroidota bacterium]